MIGGYLGAMAIAAVAAAIELATRYRDHIGTALLSLPAVAYIILNALVALLASLWLVAFYPQVVSQGTGSDISGPLLAVLGGLGSLAVLRAGVTKVTIKGQEVSAGPGVLIEGLLFVIDRLVDQKMGDYRGTTADALAPLVDFDTKAQALVTECIGRLSNLTPQEVQQLNLLLSSLAGRTDIDTKQKSRSLVMALLPVMGGRVLKQAVNSIKT